MARPKIMEDAKIISLVLDRTDLEFVERERDTSSFSKYIRCLIREQRELLDLNKEDKMMALQKELETTKTELESYKQKEQKTSERHKAELKELKDHFVMYTKHQKDKSSINNWLYTRVKSTSMSVDEAYSHLEAEGLLELPEDYKKFYREVGCDI